MGAARSAAGKFMKTDRGHPPSTSPGPPELRALVERLRRTSRKMTGPRHAILAVLRRRPRPLSAREIFEALGKAGCDLATVYRSMHTLEGAGIVRRVDFGDGGRFELVEEGAHGHHHHLVCVACSVVLDVEECISDGVERRIASRNGFKQVTHRLEFFGVCPKCQRSGKEPGRVS